MKLSEDMIKARHARFDKLVYEYLQHDAVRGDTVQDVVIMCAEPAGISLVTGGRYINALIKRADDLIMWKKGNSRRVIYRPETTEPVKAARNMQKHGVKEEYILHSLKSSFPEADGEQVMVAAACVAEHEIDIMIKNDTDEMEKKRKARMRRRR